MSQKFYSEVKLEALNNATVDTDKFLVSDSSTVKYRTGAQLLSDLGIAGIYVPYTGATGNVDLGTHTLSSYNLIVNHTSGSGVAASITKGGNGEALTINKTSGSGNAMSVTGGLTSLVDLTLSSIANATTDTDRFIVSDSGAIKYRTGAQVLSDIGGQPALTNPITGTGTTNYVSKFTGTTTLGNSLLFDNGTNVGIGTASPIAKLDVNGHINVTSAAINFGGSGSPLSTDPAIYRVGGVNDMAFAIGSNERMRITSGGNVGIGTSSPSSKLTVNTSDASANVITVTNGTQELALGVNNSSGGSFLFENNNNALRFGTAGSERMRITNTGNVGIGTTNPLTKFVVSNGGAEGMEFGYSSSLSSNYIQSINRSTFAPTDFSLFLGELGASIKFYTETVERMRIASNGNVGIGTTSPGAKLDVVANNPNAASIRITNTSDVVYSSSSLELFSHNGSSVSLGTALFSTNSNFNYGTIISNQTNLYGVRGGGIRIATGIAPIVFSNGNADIDFASERMRITSSGNVGIGTSSPTEKVDIRGGVLRISNTTNDSGTLAFGNYLNGVGYYDNGMFRGALNSIGTPGNILHIGSYEGLAFTTSAAALGSQGIRMYISGSSGYAGINTTNPQRRLDIVGDHTTATFRVYYPELNVPGQDASVDIWASEPGVSFNGSGIGSNVNGQPYYGRTNPALGQGFIRFINGTTAFHNSSGDAVNAERMRITPGGNLGIGTSSPFDALSINRYISFPNATDGSSNAYNNVDKAHIKIEAENNCLVLGIDNVVNSRLGWLQVGHNSPAFASAMGTLALNPLGGNVGVGTSTPYSKLDMQDYTSYLSLSSTINSEATTPAQQIGGIDFRKHYSLAIGASIRQLQAGGTGNYSNAHLAFYTNNGSVAFGSVPPERMRITDTGNVGIGTPNPSNPLQVNGAIVSQGGGFGGADGTFGFGGTQTSITGNAIMAYVAINTGGSGEKMRVDINGRVGIGNSSPSYPLHVSPQVSNISIYADYDIVAYSDQSVKENIRPIDNALERVVESRGVLYDRIDSGEKDNIGFIAQELEVAFPELVVTNPDGTKAVKYQNAVAVLFEAVKEQQKQIDEIKRILNGLTN